MRHSELAHVIIRILIDGQSYLLLHKNKKWNDWSLVGGHVEPGEEGDWARTAIRECEEELAPLKYMDDFIVVPLLRQPRSWGPVASKSAHGAPTRYKAQFFGLEFRRDPGECLSRLPPDDFLLAPEQGLSRSTSGVSGALHIVRSSLPGGLDDVPVSWKTSIDRSRITIREVSSALVAHEEGKASPERRRSRQRQGRVRAHAGR
jgi:hypothetical protein